MSYDYVVFFDKYTEVIVNKFDYFALCMQLMHYSMLKNIPMLKY